jgi:hypothetical protein
MPPTKPPRAPRTSVAHESSSESPPPTVGKKEMLSGAPTASAKRVIQDLYVGEDVHVRRVDCKSIVDTTTTVQQQRVHGSSMIDYSKPTDICCWHCCHGFECLPIPLPHMYDMRNKTYAVYGVFCSFSCAKSYLIDHSRFDGGHHVLLLKSMGLHVYYMNVDTVIEAPPRIDLKMFGGTMNIDEFRRCDTLRLAETPPFVPYTVIVEERSRRAQLWNLEGMRRPDLTPMQVADAGERGMYFDFLKQQDEKDAAQGSSSAPSPKTAAAPAKSSSLHKFMKVTQKPTVTTTEAEDDDDDEDMAVE